MSSKNKVIKTGITPRGRVFTGRVISRKMHKTAKVEWERRILIRKYERYEKRRSRVAAHIPDNIEVRDGDLVTIQECRPLSKTKHFIIIKNETKNESN
ncbi:30S ribosomal protein S17 [Candidatus Woesearchaeota archaeon]|nr:30S ribosomal protein S17 [Candidatus Woesearchaeota archaeon]